ncbi:MAG: bacillithiol biosynthesis deacetylase BshB1 [Bacteroidetes bacterium]|nr:bacillithiol biosynthesis deacetylase BshB1 [Bacteroidota bacterium]
MKLDILAFAAHPDDIELSCSGTIIKHISLGLKIGIVDLTQGELGTRGSSELRALEAAKASAIMGISVRENLCMADGFFDLSQENKLAIVAQIRKYRPEIILANAISDRHPDHGRASKLISDACFLSGLIKVKTVFNGTEQEAWRPKSIYHYIQDRYFKPDFIVDISKFIDKRNEAILAYASQFYDPTSTEPMTAISTAQFMDNLKGRAIEYGRIIGVEYGEGFITERVPGINNLFDLK